MEFYLPVGIVLILFSTLVAFATVTISYGLARQRAVAVAQRDATADFLKKAA
ncbi:MAG TPA: hypothetical protein VI685_01105 [Candidatus Angelobacter sp.]